MALTKVSNAMQNSAPVSVLDYGAVGDGATDDGPAVQLAIDAVAAQGRGAIIFPEGKTYKINTAVEVCDNLTVFGYGAKLVYGSGLNGITNAMFKNFTGTFNSPGTRTASVNVSFYGLEIDGQNTGSAGVLIPDADMQGVMICMGGWTANSGVDGFVVQDCYMHDFAGAAVMGWKSVNINVSSNRFTNFFANVSLSNGSAVDFHEVESAIVGTNIFNHDSTGLSWHGMVVLDWDAGSKNVNISDNIIRNMNNGDGISCEANVSGGTNMDGSVIDGNIIENCNGDGVHIQGCADVIISNNIIRGSTTGGIGISMSDTVASIIDGNTIDGDHISGIWCNGGSLLRSIITNNKIIGATYATVNYQGEGIFIYDTPTTDAHYIFISGNYIKDVDGCGIYSAPRAIVSDNFIYNFARSASATRNWGINAVGEVVNNRVVGVSGYGAYGVLAGDSQSVNGNSVTGTFSGGQYLCTPRKAYAASSNYQNFGRLEGDSSTQNITVWASSAPTGVWATGDVVYNTAPSAGGTIGWVCTAGGPSPTWKTYGSIAA